MITLARRIVASLISAIVLALGIMIVAQTGNILPLLLILIVLVLFWLVELEFRRGTIGMALQYFSVRILNSVIVIGFGAIFVYLGWSELSSPVAFSRPSHRAIFQAIRTFVGSEGLALLFFIVGAIAVAQGIQMLLRFSSLFLPKVRRNTPSRSAPETNAPPKS